MHISIVTLFPGLYDSFLHTSLIERAVNAGILSFSLENLISLAGPKNRIDSPTFGHSAGMLIEPEIIDQAIEKQEAAHRSAFKIFFSPQGRKLDQSVLHELALKLQEQKHVMLLPARYEGMDSRVEKHYADEIISIGDYVLLGGDLPAMVLIEGLVRLLPGVVGKQESIEKESFSGPFVDYPEFTAPVVWKGVEVPEIIRSGNHAGITQWRRTEAAHSTVLHHFSWLRSHILLPEDRKLAARSIPPHYVVLMHSQVMLEGEREGTSSVTSLDIHDIARSACTYGFKKYFIVTPLSDQQRIIEKLLEFWNTQVGIDYNPQRHEALRNVILVSTLDEVLAKIEGDAGSRPVLVATSAKQHEKVPGLRYDEQEKVWSFGKPVLFVFGTARGLAPTLLDQCDFLLGPIEGFSEFNHLSVRSAAAVIFDRWLGINLTISREKSSQ
jgi:tRNA (guanine37-N1)-methyltransferase